METQQLKKSQKSVKKADKQNSNSELIKREGIENSPFTIITIDGKSFGSMGQYRITETKDTVKEIKDELEKITWDRIVQVVLILNETKK